MTTVGTSGRGCASEPGMYRKLDHGYDEKTICHTVISDDHCDRAHPALAGSFHASDLEALADRVRPAGAPDAHARRLPAAMLADLASLTLLLERLPPVPVDSGHALGLSRIAEST